MRTYIALLALILVVVACRNLDGFAPGPTLTVVYVANSTSNISLLRLQPDNSLAVDQSYQVGSGTKSILFSSNNRLAFVTSSGSDELYVFSVDQELGRLTQVGGANATGTAPNNSCVHPTLNFIYTVNYNSDNITSYTFSDSGVVTGIAGSPFATLVNPHSCIVDPTGQFLYVSSPGNGALEGFSINQTSGALTSIGNFGSGGTPGAFAVDTSNTHLYNLDEGGTDVYIFPFHVSGNLNPSAISASGNSPKGIVAHPGGTYFYVANYADNTISISSRVPATGALTLLSSVTTPLGPTALAMTSNGSCLFSANFDSNTVSVFETQTDGAGLRLIGSYSSGGSGPTLLRTLSFSHP